MKLKKFNRIKVQDAWYLKRTKIRNKHHLKNKCMGGSNELWNILFLDEARHRCWHLLFKNLDLEQIIELLIRVKRIKDSQKEGGLLC